MKKIRILWNGITGRTGVEGEILSKTCDYAEIVAGICKSKSEKYYTIDQLDQIKDKFDIIVDFSHKDCFDEIINFAVKTHTPLISGTSGVSAEQLQHLEEAAKIIPIFRGGNFRLNIEKFINDVVEYAKTHDNLLLVETHYKTKKVPSETAMVVAKRVKQKTGKDVKIESHLEYDELINDWRVDKLHARVDTDGFKLLADYVFQIAKMMQGKKSGKLWDLDMLITAEKNKELKK